MASLAVLSALFGVLLGLTFRVFILVPAALLALIGLAEMGAGSEGDVVWMIALCIGVISAMQLGYASGSIVAAGMVTKVERNGSSRSPNCRAAS